MDLILTTKVTSTILLSQTTCLPFGRSALATSETTRILQLFLDNGEDLSGKSGIWLNAFASYLKQSEMTDNFIWCVNYDSFKTGGLLMSDWATPDTNKLTILKKLVPNPTKIL